MENTVSFLNSPSRCIWSHRSNCHTGKVNYVPIQFLYASIDPDELTALYTAADVCFISSTRDGMNLVSYEFVACHSSKAKQCSREIATSGRLVLSKFAGAADHMDGALIVNPWDKEDCAIALAHALSMDASEASTRMKKLGDMVEQQTRSVVVLYKRRKRFLTNRSFQWGSSFIQALRQFGKSRARKDSVWM